MQQGTLINPPALGGRYDRSRGNIVHHATHTVADVLADG